MGCGAGAEPRVRPSPAKLDDEKGLPQQLPMAGRKKEEEGGVQVDWWKTLEARLRFQKYGLR